MKEIVLLMVLAVVLAGCVPAVNSPTNPQATPEDNQSPVNTSAETEADLSGLSCKELFSKCENGEINCLQAEAECEKRCEPMQVFSKSGPLEDGWVGCEEIGALD